MKLWHIHRTDSGGYDTYDSFVVRAETEHDAREILIAEHAQDGYGDSWTRNHADVVVKELTTDGPAAIIIGSFNAG